jgi:hypothetical protein
MSATAAGTASTRTRVALPGAGGEPVREAWLRAIDAGDALYALDTASTLLPGERGTALLARCLSGGAELAGGLTVGDREALLLHLRRLSLGDAMACVLHCPAPACGSPMDLELRCSDLLIGQREESAVPLALAAEADDVRYELTYRLPTAGDMAVAGPLARHDAGAGAAAILRRCLLGATREGQPVSAEDLPEPVRAAIGAAMVAADPQAELELDLRCPACGVAFSALFDTGAFLLRELEAEATTLLRDIHTLALHYHWSEADLLRMSPGRRAQYLDLLAEAEGAAR